MTFEKHLRLVPRPASQRLGILKKSWRMFHNRLLLESCFWGLSCQFWSTVLQCGPRLPIHTLNYWTVQYVMPGSELGVCFSATSLIVDLFQFSVCCIISGVTRCTLLMMRYLGRMCECGLHAVPWSHIGILMRRLNAQPRSAPGFLFSS